jgi:hypothetical protein
MASARIVRTEAARVNYLICAILSIASQRKELTR